MKKYLSVQGMGIFTLLFSMLLLPMLHLHPAYAHVSGELEGHHHQAAIHADFFPHATHGHKHQVHHDQNVLDVAVSIEISHHSLSQIDLFSLHVGRSLQSASLFKKQPLALVQDVSLPPTYSQLQKGILLQQQAPPLQIIQFSPPTLRAPPYFV